MTDLITLPDGSSIPADRYPLPDGLQDAVMNRAQLARAFNKSENTISSWEARGMPVLTKGTNGVSYEFQFSACYAWKMGWDAAEARKRSDADQAAAQASLMFRNLDEDEQDSAGTMTAKEISDWAEAEYKRNRAAELRGELVRVDRVETVLQEILVGVTTHITTLPDFAEREFGLSNADVERFEQRCNALLTKIREDIEELLDRRTGDVVPLREGSAQDEMAV